MNRTEIAIIDSFWKLLEEKPYNKITVKNIVEQCQVNRNTFYYHFRDIPDLLERVIKKDADEIIQNYQQFETKTPSDCIKPIVQLSLKRKNAILNIYHSLQRDVFLNQLEEFTCYFVKKYIDMITEPLSISEQDKRLLARFYKCALVGVILDWLDEEMSYDLLDNFIRISRLFAGATDQALIKSTMQS
ncbi:MAG: TetR/AcrR family transcriptional regulator [Lachnospiraceae bacterium]|nr:TetR/AcrR family transcriptional regulator [Lachnospiraceae bacterium]